MYVKGGNRRNILFAHWMTVALENMCKKGIRNRRIHTMKKFLLLAMALSMSVAIVQSAQANLQIGDPAPDFSLLDVNGNVHHISDYEGQVVALNFWASW